jgi:cytochrome c556
MGKQGLWSAAVLVTLTLSAPIRAADDARQLVQMPVPMQAHMLANMRDHVRSLHEIQAALAAQKFEQAADIAENRLGMSSLEAHSAAHMAPYMPKPMQAIGDQMHRAASRFAVTVVEGDLPKSIAALSKVTEQCVTCHNGYRVR